MAKTKETNYWPHMILGFLFIGITLGYWTVRHAVSLPVQKSNEFMMQYQLADININEIKKRKALFDEKYMIEITNVKKRSYSLKNVKREKVENIVLLSKGKNSFAYYVSSKNGTVANDVNVSFLLTRPHSIKEDILVENVKVSDGKYVIKDINITKPGRYTLQLRAIVGEAVGYSELPAYLEP